MLRQQDVQSILGVVCLFFSQLMLFQTGVADCFSDKQAVNPPLPEAMRAALTWSTRGRFPHAVRNSLAAAGCCLHRAVGERC